MQLSLAIGHKAVGTVSMGELCINNKHFNIEHLVKIADVLEVDLNDFFHGVTLKQSNSKINQSPILFTRTLFLYNMHKYMEYI